MTTTLTSAQQQAFEATSVLLRGGRELLFETALADLPPSKTQTIANDDRAPQIGFVGDNYNERRILVVGINPGNGPRESRSSHDAVMFPVLHEFIGKPSHETYRAAIAAQKTAFSFWLASQELEPILHQEGIFANDIAYINSNPYRAGNGTAQDVFRTLWRKRRAAENWIRPMLSALHPAIVIAHGVAAAQILSIADKEIRPLVFNRVRIKAQRDAANAKFLDDLRARLGSR